GRQFPDEPAPRFCWAARWPGTAVPLTVTPDPGVVEVNMAPAPDLATYARWAALVHQAAGEAGLSAVRYRYNGDAVDSGGGGQLTFGGPSPAASPFFRRPWLLPGLLRYLNHHPSLSYSFASECVGSSSQGPRPDEGVRERFEELEVALAAAERPDTGPDRLWSALAPLLVDAAGNSHRAEVNVEKLWNPFLPGRGMLGLVELRALRMEPSAARMVAVAALFRALLARLAAAPYREPLVDWGSALHDRFALPHVLGDDLAGVLADLEQHGVGLGPEMSALLREGPEPVAEVELGGARLLVRRALEFWALVGDVASQERRGARLVDASNSRHEILVTGEVPGRIGAGGVEVALHPAGPGLHLAAVRHRAYVPHPGLHPSLPAQDPLVVTWQRGGEAVAISLHGWIPGGGSYPGLPADGDQARRRRRERVVVARIGEPPALRPSPPAGALTVDLRALLQSTD
ncbi:MAG TPA: transglutaminase family protein, partial [Kofleriaceae bacterium]|nr:transglutaminase family protein [Kofleriaceae bacterium]